MAHEIGLGTFAAVYLLLLVVLALMKACRIAQAKLLFVAGLRMTVQLVIAGYILTWIIRDPRPVFVLCYLAAMSAFAIRRALARNPGLNWRFRCVVGFSLLVAALPLAGFMVCGVIGESFFNPQYILPIAGMVMGNAMNGVGLGVKTFRESCASEHLRIAALTDFGCPPRRVLAPFVNRALESAMLPTLNSMLGMGIVALPGMMTGQILSGTPPTTAILYQIAILIVISSAVSLAVFLALEMGSRTLCGARNRLEELPRA